MATNVVIAKRLRFRNPQSQAKSKITSLDFQNTYWLHTSPCDWILNQHGAQRQLLLLKQTLFLNIKKRDSNNKRTSFCPDTSTMSRSLLNKRHSEHDAQLPRDFTLSHRWFIIEHHTRQPYESNLNWSIMASYDLIFTSQQLKTSFWKDMCQKSNIDTTIDFVNIQETHSLENYSEK